MDCGIVGLPGVGKTSLFSALTGLSASAAAAAGAFKAHIAIAKVPDPRLDLIASFIPTKKIVQATIQFVDIPGIAPGSGSTGSGGEASRVSTFLASVREVDALCHVVRCFEVPGTTPSPAADIDSLDTELTLSDMVIAEAAHDRAARTARTGDPDARARLAALEAALAVLNDGRPLRSAPAWTPAQMSILKSYGMITAKPVLYVANVAEDDLSGESNAAQAVRERALSAGGRSVALCAKLEAELAELDEADRLEMLRSMGLAEPAIGPLARAAYSLLGLECFYTAGEKEVRAWTVVAGATAPEAAGAIHSDIQRGFIRAECYHVDDLVRHKNEKAIKEAGKLRSEGKGYRMQDGDVVHFLFNV